MAQERAPLYPDEDEHDDEPVVATVEEIRESIDRSEYPEEDDSRQDVEERAFRRIAEKLREKGKSEEFIREHRAEIRERIRKELDQDRR